MPIHYSLALREFPGLAVAPRRIEGLIPQLVAAFWRGSGEVIDLNAHWHPRPYSVAGSGPVSTGVLQAALATIVPQQHVRPIREIGLLFAKRWAPRPDVLGVMFDTPGDPAEDPNGIPREGAAVFVDAIVATTLAAPPVAIMRTATHELGHAFNLPHDEQGATIMTQSSRVGAFTETSPEFRDFIGAHAKRLSECEWRTTVQPGGSRFYWSDANDSPFDLARSRGRLSLRCRIPRRTYLPNEPILLDLVLAPRPGGEHLVPNELDPGYARLRIWIDKPNGERVLYRALQRYCAPRGLVRVTNRKPLANNVNFFSSADGLLFSEPGEYQVWATWTMHAKRSTRIESNRESFRILSGDELDDRKTLLMREFARPDVVRAIVGRGRGVSARTMDRIASIVRTQPRAVETEILSYVLGRSALDQVHFARPDDRRAMLRFSRSQLERAANGASLGVLSRATATELARMAIPVSLSRARHSP